jgi:hypothetical protein
MGCLSPSSHPPMRIASGRALALDLHFTLLPQRTHKARPASAVFHGLPSILTTNVMPNCRTATHFEDIYRISV